MNTISLTPQRSDEDQFRHIASALQTTGYVVLPAVLPETLVDGLLLHFKSLQDEEFHRAGTGRAFDHQVNTQIRGDKIRWLAGTHPASCAYLEWIEALRLNLNRYLFLGLFDYECHYAYYPVGTFYRKHLDTFRTNASRVLSTVLYLNPIWEPEDGGELLLYSSQDELLESILPSYGKMVIFLSEVFPHEVLPVKKVRYSVTGWFRVNNTLGTNLDPPK